MHGHSLKHTAELGDEAVVIIGSPANISRSNAGKRTRTGRFGWEAVMKRILVTGGTTFVSKYVAKYFVDADYEVYVLNRNSKSQAPGVKLIEGDRHHLGSTLKDKYFDVVADITAYNASNIIDLYDSLGSFGQYIMISSSAVYPEYAPQPFREDTEKSANKFWGKYGTDKIEAESALLDRVHDAYILRPPYLYGPMNNVYREAFVFDCAKTDRKFYLPQNGDMKLQSGMLNMKQK